MIALYLLFLPPYSPIDPETAADYTAIEYDYVVDDRTCNSPEIPPQFKFLFIALL